MGLFNGKEEKEAKKLEKMNAIAAKYHLNGINPVDLEAIRDINYELMGTGLMEFGATLTAKSEDSVKIAYLNTLIQQNWIMIRQLDEISKKLDK